MSNDAFFFVFFAVIFVTGVGVMLLKDWLADWAVIDGDAGRMARNFGTPAQVIPMDFIGEGTVIWTR